MRKPPPSLESILLQKIIDSTDPAARDAWMDELDRIPVERFCFYERWRRIYDVGEFQCWTESGFDSSRSQWPLDAQLLWAMKYGKADIDNGGLHQFFWNGTGILAPEMREWCERAGFPAVANTLEEAMAFFGRTYPRSQEIRWQKLEDRIQDIGFERGREAWDPFIDLDHRFYEALPDSTFDAATNRWLREVCGIRRLRQPSPGVAG